MNHPYHCLGQFESARAHRKKSQSQLALAVQKQGGTFQPMSEFVARAQLGKQSIYFCDLAPQSRSAVARMLSVNKQLLHLWLTHAGFPTNLGKRFESKDSQRAWQWLQTQMGRFVLRPLGTKNLSLRLYFEPASYEQFIAAWEQIAGSCSAVWVQQQIVANDYRILVSNKKILAVLKQQPLVVQGNGHDNLAQLLDRLDPSLMTSALVRAHLRAQGFAADMVLDKDQQLFFSHFVNPHVIKNFIPCTDTLCPQFREKIDQLLAVFPDSGILMLRLLAEDLSLSPEQQQWVVDDILSNPYLSYYFDDDSHIQSLYRQILLDAMDIQNTRKQHTASVNPASTKSRTAPIWDGNSSYHRHDYGSNREVMIRAAMRRNLQYLPLNQDFYLLQGENQRVLFYKNMPQQTSHVARVLVTVKPQTREILQQAGIATPQGRAFAITQQQQAAAYARQLGYPVVVKPNAGSGGKGVTTHIMDEQTLLAAIAAQNSPQFIVEQHIFGSECRIVVAGSQVLVAMLRHAAHVVGNGRDTLQQLMAKKSQKRKKIPHLSKSVLSLSPFVEKALAREGIDRNSVLAKGQKVFVQTVSNAGLGGDTEDFTEQLHPGFGKIACDVLAAFPSMFYCGMDVQAEDFSRSPDEQKWAILEVNENPDFAIHYFPWKGKPRDVAGALLDSLFAPPGPVSCLSRTLIIKGKVQGVFYRKWLQHQAYLHSVNGWVQNQQDGSVMAVLTGTAVAVKRLVSLCHRGPAKAVVREVRIIADEQTEKPTHQRFEIRR